MTRMMGAPPWSMRTTVTLDDQLLAKAEQLCGHLERSALLKEALGALAAVQISFEDGTWIRAGSASNSGGDISRESL